MDRELISPSQEFLKLVGKKTGITPLTKPNLELLRPLITEAISRHLRPTHPTGAHGPSPQAPSPLSSPTDTSSTDFADLTAGQKAVHTLAKFKGATLFGEPLAVENYTQLLVSVVEGLLTRHPDQFAKLVQKDPFCKPSRKWQWISTNEHDIYPANPRRNIGQYFFDVGALPKTKRRRRFC